MLMTIAGYQIQEKIYESDHSLVYRGHQEGDNQPVVLKMLQQTYPPPEKTAWFLREYELTKSLTLAGTIRAYHLTTDQHRPVMVLEDFGGSSLELLLLTRRFALDEFLELAIRIVDIVGHLHQQHIIHKDVNPANIVFNPTTGQLKLIDFGIATVLSRENPFLRNPGVVEGTLAYISPEQTGRMNRAIDYRADFYSLGVTFYELLTGQVPFLPTDTMEIIHAHLAKYPPSPHQYQADIPPPVSDIVMKLMSKNAEDRYQSAYGLKADLETCQRQWRETGQIAPFPLGQHDVTDHFHISQKLYGRAPESAALLAAFERVSQGASEMLLVSGPAGSGKSVLVQEVYKPITLRQGYFIAGKCEQLYGNIPYFALTQAFRSLLRQLLTANAAQVATWRDTLLGALGPNGQIMIDLVPELALLVGPQPAVPALPPAEAQNRLHLVLQHFIHVFTSPEHPLVLFLDDLQWADGALLHLLQQLMTSWDNRYFFVIGAYRDNEVHAAHPLQLTLDAIRKAGTRVHHTTLASLGLPHVKQFVSDTLKCPVERATPLAALILAKTHGNPFFIMEFLQSLYAEELLQFDFQSRSWQWNVARIQARGITNNVVELLSDKVQKLAEQTQDILKLAACIGSRFDLHTLAIVSQHSSRATAAHLWEALVEGLIVPLGDVYKLMDLDVQGLEEAVTVEYRFAHDRIQQAAYALIPAETKQAIHWQVGQLLLQNTPPDKCEQNLFDIVNHLNLGREHLHLQEERDTLAEFNLRAARKAKSAVAYEPALNYLQVGLALVGEEGWQRQYDLALALHVEAAEAAYLSGNFVRLKQLTEVVLQYAQTLLDKVPVYEFNAQAGYSGQPRIVEGIQIGLEVLALLGMPLPEKPSQTEVTRALEETRLALAGKNIEDLVALPVMTEPHQLATVRILTRLSSPAYVGAPDLFVLIILRLVSLSVTYGNTAFTARAYAFYGLILCGLVGDIDAGYRFGQLALRLLERFNAHAMKSGTVFTVNAHVRHWKEHIKETLQPLLEAYQSGLETGATVYAAVAAFDYIFQSYWIGTELAKLEQEIVKYSEAIGQIKQEMILNLTQLYHQVVLNLMGRTEHPCRLIGTRYDEEVILPLLLAAHNMNALAQVYLHKLILCYLFQDYSQAIAHAAIAEKYLRGVLGTPAIPIFYYYDTLTKLAVLPAVPESEQEHLRQQVDANQAKMQTWAQHAPMNYGHKLSLMEAERARVLGKVNEARDAYDQAIDLACQHGYVNDEALANELAAKFYLTRGHSRIASHYLRDAHYAYMRWGAVAKVQALEKHYPQFLDRATSAHRPGAFSHSSSDQEQSSALDITSVLKASQALASEIVLDQLLDKLMKIVIENAGAQRGCLILEKAGELVVEAEKAVESDNVVVVQSLPVAARPDLPVTLLHYVERTQEEVVLDDATQEDLFATDPYIVKDQPRSLLCLPLVRQGKLIGMLYLENNLITGAFTPERLAVLRLLSSQEIISIENARLYQSLEKANMQLENYSKSLEYMVQARTHELQDKNRELERANQHIQAGAERKVRFFTHMSHELRIPLDAIIGFSEVLQEQTFGALNVQQEEYVNYILTSGNHLLSLVNDLLDLAKIEAGKMELQPEVCALRPLLEESLIVVQEHALARSIALSLDMAHDVTTVVADARCVKQILFNLLSNAVKFTSEHGQVGIKVSKVAARVQITVWDTGRGIALADQWRIFEEFEQVGPWQLGQARGTGLGLALTRKLVELHGGTITVESSPGQGSNFRFTLPATDPSHLALA